MTQPNKIREPIVIVLPDRIKRKSKPFFDVNRYNGKFRKLKKDVYSKVGYSNSKIYTCSTDGAKTQIKFKTLKK
jgi:hypothetical protein